MNTNLTSNLPQRGRIHPLAAGAAVAVILASATGIAAMTGMLPASRATTTPSTPAVPVTTQIASAPATSLQPNTEQRVTHEETSAQKEPEPTTGLGA
jgi:hypothetical protein